MAATERRLADSAANDRYTFGGVDLSWLDGATSAEAVAAVRGHPAFDEACLEATRGIVNLYNGSRLINRVLNDRARTVFALSALYFHVCPEPDGTRLTAARLLAFCAETGICSRGRARAMLALLLWSGYIERGPEADDRRIRPLLPTAALWNSAIMRWRECLNAYGRIDARAASMSAALEQEPYAAAFILRIGGAFRSGFRLLNGAPILSSLAERDGGLMVMMTFYIASRTGTSPPTVAALARRFHLSRAQVLDLIREAEALGLVRRDDRVVEVLPSLIDAIGDFFAMCFAMVTAASEQALAAVKP